MKVYRDIVVNGTTTQTEIFEIAECTYSGKDMGERSITANIKWPTPIGFQIGDYVVLQMQTLIRSTTGVDGGVNSEKFYLYTMPTIKKNASPMSSGRAFEHTVVFYPAQYELGLIQMRDCGQEQANVDTIIYTGFDTLSFVGGADELMCRIMAVLKEAYHDADGNPLWSYKIADTVNENKNTALERVSLSFSGNSVMDALLKLNDEEGLNTTFFINGRTIYVGYKRPYFCRVTDGGSIDTTPSSQMFQFQYGKTSHQPIALGHGGLYQITKALGKESPITKLFAYGAARNLNRYYCSDRIQSGRYVNRLMLPSFDADGKTDYILSEDSIKKYGIREGSKQFEEIYPSLRYMTYGDLRQIKYCVKIKSSGITDDSLEKGNSAYPVARVQCYKVVPSGKTTGINKLVEAAPPDDLCVIVHAMGKTVKVVLYGGSSDNEAIAKQRQHDTKVPTRTANGTNYIPGSCFLVHDRGFDSNKTYQCENRGEWFSNPNNISSLSDAKRTEINMSQIQYEDTFWLSDLYIFEGYQQTHFGRDGYSAWAWPRTTIDYQGGSADSTIVNEVAAVEPIVIEDTSSNVDDLETQQKTFDIYLKDVGFKIDEQNDFGDMVFVVGTELKISMLDGLMAGREFTAAGKITDKQYTCICAYNEDGSLNDDFFMDSDYNKGRTIPQAALNAGAIWRICCNRINLDEADYSNLNLILPTKDLCVKKGDHLVFLDIFMPDIYIHAAENRLLREARKYLNANDNGSVSYSAQFDKVRLQQIPNYALQMREGLNIRMVDNDLGISTDNDGRYLLNYGDKPLYSSVDVPYTRSTWEYVSTYKTANAYNGVTQEFMDKFGNIPENGDEMTVRIVLQNDETWIDVAPVQIMQGDTTYTMGVPIRALSYGWSEADGGYLYMLIFATPSGLDLSSSMTIKRHQIKADSTLKKNVWLSSNDAIDFTKGRFYTFKCAVKDTGYLAMANALALVSTKNDGIDGAKFLPTYTMQAEHKEKSSLLYLTFKFELPSNFNDDVVYYPSLLFKTDSRESSVGIWVESVYEKDYADGTAKLNYADFTIDSLTIKITNSNSNTAPIREITASFSENPAATAWATLMSNIENTRITGEQSEKAIETLVNTARKNYQTLLNLKNSIFDPDGSCDQTFLQVMMMQVGADSMNYQLDKTRTGLSANGQQVFHNCKIEEVGGNWHFKVTNADTLRHYVYTQGAQGGTWAITNGIDAPLDGESNYFVCVKCSREGNAGEWICSTKQYAVNDAEDTNSWFFNWGILTVDSGGVYTLVETRGNAYMYGDNLVCGKISTLAGASYFDLTHGNFVLSDGTTTALSYIDGVLTIGNVNDERVDEVLERLGLVEKAQWVNLYAGGDLSFNYLSGSYPFHSSLIRELPKGTYKTAITSENNGKDGSVAFDGFENSCLVWFKAGAGDGYDTNDVLQGHKDEILTISNWGEDVTINEPADVVVYTCIKAVLQGVINGANPSEFPANGTWTINGIQIMGLVSAATKDALATANTAKDSIDNLEVGGENLYTGDNPLTIAADATNNYNYVTLVSGLQNNARYVFSCGKSVVKAGSTTEYAVLLLDFNASRDSQIKKLAVGTTRVEQAFTIPSTGTWDMLIYSGVNGSTAGISMEFTDIMVQKGNRATAYQTAVGFLGKALKDGSTEVAGGLLMTNVLMLKDENNNVTAGMSGMTGTTDNPEKVLLWGGGDYNDATNAAADTTGEYKKSNGTPITTLLKKDGTGKIGIFKISDDEVIIDNGGSKTIITTDTIANVASANNIGYTTFNKTYSSTSMASQARVLMEKTFDGTLNGTVKIPYLDVSVGIRGSDSLRQATAILKITVTYNGGQTETIKNEEIYITANNSQGTSIKISNFSKSYTKIQSFKIELASGSQTLYGSIYVYFNCYVGTAGNGQTAVIAKDGIMVSSDNGGRFIVSPAGDAMSVVADIPIVETAADVNKLSVGQLFTDSSGIVRRYSLDDELDTDYARNFVSIRYLKSGGNARDSLTFDQFRTTLYSLSVRNYTILQGSVTMTGLASDYDSADSNELYKYGNYDIRHHRK